MDAAATTAFHVDEAVVGEGRPRGAGIIPAVACADLTSDPSVGLETFIICLWDAEVDYWRVTCFFLCLRMHVLVRITLTAQSLPLCFAVNGCDIRSPNSAPYLSDAMREVMADPQAAAALGSAGFGRTPTEVSGALMAGPARRARNRSGVTATRLQ